MDTGNTEKPSRWAWLDKPFTLWVFSTVIISTLVPLFGALFAERQQCHEQAQSTLSKVFPLLDEISGRISALREKIQKNPNDPDIVSLIEGRIAYHPGYKDQSLFVMLSSYNQAAGKIAASLLPDVPEPPPPRPPAPPVPPTPRMPKTGGSDLKLYLDTADISTFPALPSKAAIEHDYSLVLWRRVALDRGNVVELCTYSRALRNIFFGYSGEPLLRIQ